MECFSGTCLTTHGCLEQTPSVHRRLLWRICYPRSCNNHPIRHIIRMQLQQVLPVILAMNKTRSSRSMLMSWVEIWAQSCRKHWATTLCHGQTVSANSRVYSDKIRHLTTKPFIQSLLDLTDAILCSSFVSSLTARSLRISSLPPPTTITRTSRLICSIRAPLPPL